MIYRRGAENAVDALRNDEKLFSQRNLRVLSDSAVNPET